MKRHITHLHSVALSGLFLLVIVFSSVTPCFGESAASQPGPFAGDTYDASDDSGYIDTSVSAPATSPAGDQPAPSNSQEATVQRLERKVIEMEQELTRMKEEAEIRNQLTATEEEQKQSEEEILSAVSRSYTLMKKGFLGFEYSFRYGANTYDAFIRANEANAIEHIGNHTITNSFLVEYALLENLTLGLDVPFVYKFDNGTYGSMSTTDIGDVSLSAQWQPFKSGGDRPSTIVNIGVSLPSGRSPYKINPEQGLSTGNGGTALTTGLSMSKSVDPLVAFGSLSYTHYLPIDGLRYQQGSQGEAGIYLQQVDVGDSFGFSMGLGYSLSYKVSLSLSWSFSYSLETDYDYVGTTDFSSEDSIQSSFSIATGWRVTPQRTINTRIGFGLTNNDTDVTLQVRVPFQFEL